MENSNRYNNILQGVGLASLAHSLFMNFETVVSTGWRAGIDCKRAGWRSGQGRGDVWTLLSSLSTCTTRGRKGLAKVTFD